MSTQHRAGSNPAGITVADLAAEHRAAAQRRHPAGRRTMARAVVTLTAAGLLASGTGIASAAAPSPQSQHAALCFHHPDACETPAPLRPSYLDTDPSVLRNGGHLTVWQRIRGVEKELLNLL